MKVTLLITAAAGVFLTGCSGDSSSSSQTATNSPPTNFANGNPLTVVPDYIGVVGQAQKYSVKQIDLSYLHEAIQQFNVAEGRYPKNLQEMVPNYIGKVPDAPYGSKIVYDPNTGTVKVVPQSQ